MNSKRLLLALIAAGSLLVGAYAVQAAEAPAAHDAHNAAPAAAAQQAPKGQFELTPEKQAKLEAIVKEYDAKLIPLREKLWAKMTELDALSGNAQVQPKVISTLAAEAGELRTELRKVYEARAERLEKEVGLPGGRLRGMGHPGMMGGHGGMMGGEGGMMGKGGCPGMAKMMQGGGCGGCPGMAGMAGGANPDDAPAKQDTPKTGKPK